MRRLVLCGGIFLAAVANAGEEKKAAPSERPPGLILAYKKAGTGRLSATCADIGRNAISCDFVEVFFMPPSNDQADKGEREILDKFKNDPEEAKREVAQMRATYEAGKAEVAKKPLSPKVKREFADITDALASNDPGRIAHALVEHERRTCKVITQSWTTKFHRLGTRKWLSDAEPEGLCRVVQVMELSSDDPHSLLWSVTSRTVSVGETAGPFCSIAAKAVGEVDEWKWNTTPNEYELPCDFVAYGP